MNFKVFNFYTHHSLDLKATECRLVQLASVIVSVWAGVVFSSVTVKVTELPAPRLRVRVKVLDETE